MVFNDVSPQDGPQNDPRPGQDSPKTVSETFFFHCDFCLRFWIVLGSVLVPFWDPFGPQDRLKIDPKTYQNYVGAIDPR